jgi:hypothetical protein
MKPTLHPAPTAALERLSRKQRVGGEHADDIELRVLLHFDAAHRGRCTVDGYYFLAAHLVRAAYLGKRLGSERFYAAAVEAALALNRAGRRPSALLGLTTGEYQALRRALRTYFHTLPDLEVGVLADANQVAEAQAQLALAGQGA